jgi:tRNA(fMet)-specific endonuclease VapC
VTKAEILTGVGLASHPEKHRTVANEFLGTVPVLDFPDAATPHYADMRADLQRRGELIGANDLFIAAHARALDLTLVTNNTREFSCVRGLRLENWVAS